MVQLNSLAPFRKAKGTFLKYRWYRKSLRIMPILMLEVAKNGHSFTMAGLSPYKKFCLNVQLNSLAPFRKAKGTFLKYRLYRKSLRIMPILMLEVAKTGHSFTMAGLSPYKKFCLNGSIKLIGAL